MVRRLTNKLYAQELKRLSAADTQCSTGSPRRNVRRVDKVEPALGYRRLTHMARMELPRRRDAILIRANTTPRWDIISLKLKT